MTDTTHTHTDGASVGGNARAGRDFSGRDSYNLDGAPSGNRVDIHTEPQRGDYSSAEILQNLQKAILGNPYNLAEPGLLKSIAELSVSVMGLHTWRSAADAERVNLSREIKNYQARTDQRLETTDSRLTAFMVIVWVTVSIVGVEAIALIWLFVQRSIGG